MKYPPNYKKLQKKDELRIICNRCEHYEKRSKRHGWCQKHSTPTQPLSTACKQFVLSEELKRAGKAMAEAARRAFEGMTKVK